MGSGAMGPRDYPLADDEFTVTVLKVIELANMYGQLKKGTKGAAKSLNKGISGFLVLAADTNPMDRLLHLPSLAEEKNVPFVFVPSSDALGKACALGRPEIACSVITSGGSQLKSEIQELKDIIERSKASYLRRLKSQTSRHVYGL